MTDRYIVAKDVDHEEYYVIDTYADGIPEVIITCSSLASARKEIEALSRQDAS